MQRITNITNKIIHPIKKSAEEPVFKANQTPALNTELPSTHSVGASLVNKNVPIAYSKIGEMEIPGLKDKASVFKLSNGQKVVIAPKKGPTMVKTAYNVGAINETEDIKGMSHYIEHNLFNGSKDLAPKEYDKQLSELGGITNANTNYATTNYFLQLQLIEEGFLEEAIRLNALQTQFPTFPQEQLEKEKEPVKSEIDVYKDMPDDITHNQAINDLFGIKTPASNYILGTKDNINSFTREKVLDYYNTWYTPDNAVTVITGDVDVDETISLVSKYYNKPNDYSNVNKRHTQPLQYNDKPIRRDIISPNATIPHISMGFAIPEGTSKSDLEKISMAFNILESPNSTLSKRLDKIGAKFDFNEEKIQNKPDGARARMIEVDIPEQNLEQALKIIYEEITNISNNPTPQENLDNIKNRKINHLNSVTESSNTLNDFISDAALNGDFDYWKNTSNIIKSITPEDIMQSVRQYIDLNKTAICIAHPQTVKNEAIGSTTARTVSFGKSINPKQSIQEEIAKVREFRLPNNIETMIIPGNQYAKTYAEIEFSTSELNGVSKEAFNLLTRLLNRGSAITPKDTLDEIKLQKDIDIDFISMNDGMLISISAYDDKLQDSLGIMKEILANPNFSQADFEAEKKKVYDELMAEEKTSLSKVEEEFFKGTRSYASKEQRLKELEALTLDDIRNLYSFILSSSQVNASLTAAVEEKPYLQDIFNSELSNNMGVYKPYSKQKPASYYTYTPNTEAKIIVQADERNQADVIKAYKYKKPENTSDIAKINILNYILGGGMSSRLFTDLRETQKLAYSVDSHISTNKDTQIIYLGIETTTESPDPNEGSPENINKAIEGFDRNINLLRTQNVSDKELENAKIGLKSEILSSIETNIGKTFIFSNYKSSPYDIQFLTEIYNEIDKLTPDDIRAAANYVFKDAPVTSIVASQKTLDTLNLK